jgi:hypothetical protein
MDTHMNVNELQKMLDDVINGKCNDDGNCDSVVNGRDGDGSDVDPIESSGDVVIGDSNNPLDNMANVYVELADAFDSLSNTLQLIQLFSGIPRPLSPELNAVFTKSINAFLAEQQMVMALLKLAKLTSQ